ncbi:TonB-dependent receptor plug domain-containing protein [Novosphingobium terrae]|uniref:TonB-dependent receptor plug domain-containing protein n=1 Tax=Novosphingobium terrae TaxID=2726189 RepID=UPI001980230C|nr:TonB-dependent receptor [Novosphingobium terrae]
MKDRFIGVSVVAMMCATTAQAQTAEPSVGATPPAAITQAQDTPAQSTVDQTADAPGSSSAGTSASPSASDIIVTGSRIARKDYQSASPILTTNQEALKASGSVNIEGSLNQLPQFVPGTGSQAGGGTAAATGGRATLNLRGLGDRRNLVLLDGRRLPPSNMFNVVDVNVVPMSLIESVETITGGASAVYGSDAVSGVVNFRTRRKMHGVEFDGQIGNTFLGDRKTVDLSATGGFSAIDGRLNVIGSVSYTQRDELLAPQRSFFDQASLSGYIGQGLYVPAGDNLPSQAAVNAAFANQAPGTVARTNSLGFNNNGSLFSQLGATNFQGAVPPNYTTVGGSFRQISSQQQTFDRPLERETGFMRAEFEINDALTLYGQGLYSHTDTNVSAGNSLTQFITASVSPNNPFIPASLASILASRPNPTANFTLNKRFVELPWRRVYTQFDTSQIIAGLRGKFGIGDWTFDLYGSRDRNIVNTSIPYGVLGDRVNKLLQASDGGASLCTGGYNPFGLANVTAISPSCVAYMTANIRSRESIQQNTVEGSAQGSLFKLPAGDAKLSVVATYRDNKYSFAPDAQLVAGNVFATNQTNPTSGSTSVKEIAGELFVPILVDKPFVRALNLTGGLRRSQYNITGGVTTWKGELEWSPARAILFRGGYQRAIRAPNIGELFSSATGSQVQFGNPPTAGDPCDVRGSARSGANAAKLRALCVATGVPDGLADSYTYATNAIASITTGSTALKPEKASTLTAGVVLRPRFNSPALANVSFSVDFYDIRITDVISTVAGNTALSKCYNLDGSNPTYSASNPFCALVKRDATGGISSVNLPYQNLGGLRTRGVDFQLDWTARLGNWGKLGKANFALNSVISYLDSYKIENLPGQGFQEFAGTIDYTNGLPLPRWRYTTTGNLSLGKVGVGLRWRHLDGMRDVSSVISPSAVAPGVPAYDIFDLTGQVSVNERLQIRFGVTNLANKQPPVVGGVLGQTLPGTYDIIGRSFYMGAKVHF